ncbi:unnamed protein product [Scytosiphon promiscuus]
MGPRGSQGSQEVCRAKPAFVQGSSGRTDSNGMSDESSLCAVSESTSSRITASARRNEVYEKIMKEWQEAASSAIPRPRSSHRRILGGQALPTRERGESFSRESISGSLPLSWGNLSDTVSPAVQSAWREQLLELKLSRLAGVPKTVLLRQRTRSSLGTVDGCRIVTTPQTLSAKLAALAVIEGTCSNVPLSAAATSSPLHVATKSSDFPREGEGETVGKVVTAATRGDFHQGCAKQQLQQPGQQGRYDNASGGDGRGAESSGFVAEAREEVDASRGCANALNPPVPVVTRGTGNPSSSARRRETSGATATMATPLLTGRAEPSPAKLPVTRGFHLVDLHAVVRNSVEWSHCLPKVEPCFRVGSNRDVVLLGLVHALGARLSCSSAHDIKAGVCGARGASPVPAPPPRLLDRHVCRSPALLRSSVAAGVQLFEVDSADELRRIRAARRPKRRVSAASRSSGTPTPAGALGEKGSSPRPVKASSTPTGVIVRLAVPPRPPGNLRDGSEAVAAATVGDFSGALEAAYGATSEDVVELVRAAAAAEESEVGPASSGVDGRGNRNGGSIPLRIIGFSIDVGSSCVEDAHAGGASALPARDQGRPGASALGAAGVAPGEAVASAALAESIDAAVAFAVEMAGVAATAAAATAAAAVDSAGEVATAPHADAGKGVTSGEFAGEEAAVEHPKPAEGSGTSESAAAAAMMPTSSPQPSSPPPFSFRRLHVTGLGDGGARGEPLAALKAALSRHLPIASAVKTTPKGNGRSGRAEGGTSPLSTPASRPIVVSADATEHLVARGVWSTVASIIGRKSVPPVVDDDNEDNGDAAATARSSVGGEHANPSEHRPCIAGEEPCCPAGEDAIADGGDAGGGAMYYVDDGCYGSLSGALLRGVQMQPSPLRARRRPPPPPPPPPLIQPEVSPSRLLVTAGAFPRETKHNRRNDGAGAGSGADASPPGSSPPVPIASPRAKELPCTVWGPTCDGLDCVCRMTQLPDDLEPGQDWLFFPDVGIRGGADVTDFNGLRPLDPFYLIRERDDTASPAPAPAPTARRAPAARAVSP